MTDGRGVPLAVDVTAGQAHEPMSCKPLVQRVMDEHGDARPGKLCGDKGYSYDRIRAFLEERDIEAVIPRRKDQRVEGDEDAFDRETYRRRSVVENCIGWLKECRALATRFEKLATNFLGVLHLAIIQRYLRLLNSSDRT